MLPYILILVIVISWIYVFYKANGTHTLIIPGFILVLFASIRSYHVGSDTMVYVDNFIKNLDVNYYNFNSDVELGYQLYELFILKFTHEYFWFLFFSSFFVVTFHLKTIKKLSINYLQSVLIFITFGFYTFFFNGLRQGIAMAICFFGLPYLIEKRTLYYSATIFIASLFHVSALIMFPLYFLIKSKLKLELKFLACLITSTLVSQILIGYLAQSNARYENYIQEVEQAGGYITLAFYFFIGLVVYLTGHKIRKEDIKFNKFEQILLCGLALVLPIAILGTDPSGPQRVLYYFTSTVIFLLPYILRKYHNIYINFLFFILSIVYFILITTRFSNLYPYSINPVFEIF